MNTGKRIKKFREKKGYSTNDLSKLTGISQSTISKLENGKRKYDVETLTKIAEALDVSIDRLTGESASSIIDNRLEEIGMTLPELAKRADVPLTFLQNLDNIVPDYEVDLGEQCYRYMTTIAWVLGLPGSKLRLAFARQETPVYDGPSCSPEEDFGLCVRETVAEYNTKNLVPVTGKIIRIPLLGSIPAGIPVECEENIIDYIDTPESQVMNGEYFYLKVKGDSMIGSGIMDGYTVLVKKQSDVENGEIAVVRVNSHEATLKRVKKINGQVILYPDNIKYDPIVITSDEAEIIGKVIKVEFDPNKKY